ncbi:hypothetical protein T03_10577 [Trichinella britovi]|uniref:Uncharacterized protein n=1 Tax=Trichinella britovi TaxID=45882 RepID=A0A0V1DHZ0_TRIBR|nr:hypothetical protein T03_10577 [Trichinella britovi]
MAVAEASKWSWFPHFWLASLAKGNAFGHNNHLGVRMCVVMLGNLSTFVSNGQAVSIGLFPYPEKTPSFACSSNSDAFSVWQIVAAKLFSLLLNRLKSASTSWLTIRPRHHRENHHKLESNRQRKHCKSVSQITKNSFT